MGDRDNAPAAAPLETDAPPAGAGAAAGGVKGMGARLRALPPHMIVAAAFFVAVLAGVGVTAVEYWVHGQTSRGRALVDLAAAPARIAAPAPPAPPAPTAPTAPTAAIADPVSPPSAASSPAAPVARAPASATQARARARKPASRPAKQAAKSPGHPAQTARTAQTPRTSQTARASQTARTSKISKAPPADVPVVAQRPADAAAKPAPTLDERYESAIRQKCRRGALGLPCREMVRWRLCEGRWHRGRRPGETRCYVPRDESAFPPLVVGAAPRCPT